MKKPAKKETEKDRIEQLEYRLANLAKSFAEQENKITRIRQHIHNLECDKTTLIKQIQALNRSQGPRILYRQTNNPPCILDDSIPSCDERIYCQYQ